MLHATVDTDGPGDVHILFEVGRLRAIHYTTEPENERNSHFTVHRADSMLFLVSNTSHRSFRIDIDEVAAETFLQVRIRTVNGAAAMNFNLDGHEGKHIAPGEDKTLIYTKSQGANVRVNP